MVTKAHSTYEIKEKIDLTPKEQQIFDLFTTFVKENKVNTVIRVAGGWVRDKVLGRESSDIDFALENMMGEDFVKQAHEYLKGKADVGGFGVTKLNPEKSKHLETAKIRIQDIWIDIVNLRGEEYADDSRIPQMRIGTPEEDALRRDLTINALFYNLHTSQIEDFTKQGLPDLREGIARTPLPSEQTFIDDPLRILRVFRFVARYDLVIDKDIVDALAKKEIMEGLQKKVSKERIGTEVKSMFSNIRAFTSFQNFRKFNVFPYMIEIPDKCPDLYQNEDKIAQCFDFGFHLAESITNKFFKDGKFSYNQTIENSGFEQSEIRFLTYLSCIIYPFRNYKVQNKKKLDSLVPFLVKEQLKFPNNDADIVSANCIAAEEFKNIARLFSDEKDVLLLVARTIKSLKNWAKTWEIGFLLALNDDILSSKEPEQIANLYEKLYTYIYSNNLNRVYQVEYLLDGKQIQELFGVKGPAIQTIKENVFYWQVRNPAEKIEGLKAAIENNKDQFLADPFK